jgi:hypothetical protein
MMDFPRELLDVPIAGAHDKTVVLQLHDNRQYAYKLLNIIYL